MDIGVLGCKTVLISGNTQGLWRNILPPSLEKHSLRFWYASACPHALVPKSKTISQRGKNHKSYPTLLLI
jgi:hypothetical protein